MTKLLTVGLVMGSVVVIVYAVAFILCEVLKARKIVQEFFDLSTEVEIFYDLFTASQQCEEIDSQKTRVCLNVTNKDVSEVLNLAQRAIQCYEENELQEFEEPSMIRRYYKLNTIATKLRKWLKEERKV